MKKILLLLFVVIFTQCQKLQWFDYPDSPYYQCPALDYANYDSLNYSNQDNSQNISLVYTTNTTKNSSVFLSNESYIKKYQYDETKYKFNNDSMKFFFSIDGNPNNDYFHKIYLDFIKGTSFNTYIGVYIGDTTINNILYSEVVKFKCDTIIKQTLFNYSKGLIQFTLDNYEVYTLNNN